MYRLDDQKIKKLIEKWQNYFIEKDWDEIMTQIAPVIRAYPALCHKENEDICSEFFVWLYPQLKKILSSYKISEALFITWFFVVLRNRYLNFISSYKKDIQTVPLEIKKENKFILLSDIKDFNLWKENKNRNDTIKKLLKSTVKRLPTHKRLLLHLLFDELSPEEIRKINPSKDSIKLYEEYCILNLKINDRFQREQERCEILRNKILQLKNAENYKKNSKKIILLETKLKNLMYKMSHHENSIPYRWISKLTDRSIPSLKKDFKEIKRMIKEEIGPLVIKEG